ncbi:DUF4383 domain-containing protein [Saccharopolyspora mangrovi]|uniref:DUF4383 domain-containing protein n=1 Tax=Saccharopolyspora mangrovi TaxID=3082379 RepID=A0ABU6AA89_9PSEU|nr:DUF4383 domain-containing protein [Saccharopolyspora sp. S2-29]MEB3368454.1 DUF4383 domain-containing protein [Saccharopolyspora sp. S2-29]
MDRYLPPEHPLNRFYRVAAAVFGAGLMVFGVLGLANRVPLLTTDGIDVLGLSSNGLLAVVSIVVGAILVGAAAWGGPVASTTTAAIGVLFFLSGLINLGVLNTSWNLFAFELQNVVFSFVAGLALMFIGFYGRVSGGLPDDNPYVRYRHHEPPVQEDPDSVIADERRISELEPMCNDEMAVAEGKATPEQRRRVTADRLRHVQQERRRAYDHYRESGRSEQQQISAQNPWADFHQSKNAQP